MKTSSTISRRRTLRFLLVLVVPLASNGMRFQTPTRTKRTSITAPTQFTTEANLAPITIVEPPTSSGGKGSDGDGDGDGDGSESIFARALHMRRQQLKRFERRRNIRVYQRQKKNRDKDHTMVMTEEDQLRAHTLLSPHPSLNIPELDPWGLEKQRSHLTLPSWACVDATEERHLAAMKVVLELELRDLQRKTITRPDGQRVPVIEAFPDVYSDFRLLRFLRKDKVQDPVTAALRYREFLQFREDHQVDKLRLRVEEQRHQEKDIFSPPSALRVVGDFLPCSFQEEPNRNGVVPILIQVGEWDTQGITKLIRSNESSITAFLQYWTYLFEALHFHLYEESLKSQQMVFIDEVCDLEGIMLSQFSPAFVTHVLKPWIHLTQSNYPETVKHIIFLQPPKILSLVWRIVAPMVSKGTVAKVSMDTKFGGSGEDYCIERYNAPLVALSLRE